LILSQHLETQIQYNNALVGENAAERRNDKEHPMIQGSCLCGGIRFEIDHATGPFELCHCKRCRKVSGSAFMSGVGVRREDFTFLSGQELIKQYEAPLLESPPLYRVCFCTNCGSPVPDPEDQSEWFEIPAGLLDDDPQIRPDKHIFIEAKAHWFAITDALPQLDKKALVHHRTGET
jgi:hypothetical protein